MVGGLLHATDARALAECVGLAPFREPHFVSSSDWIEHTPFAFWVVDAVRPSFFAELGIRQAQSYMAFCQAIQSLDTSCQSLAIGMTCDNRDAGIDSHEITDSLRAVHDSKYRAFSQLVQAGSSAASLSVPDGTVDLLHIDRHRSETGVQADVDEWIPKMSAGGVILMHDTGVRTGDSGVHDVWARLSGQHPSFEFHHGLGLGLVAVGSRIPDKVGLLIEAGQDPERAAWIRTLFARLGAAVKLEFERDVAREAELQVARLEKQVFDLAAQRVALQQRLSDSEREARAQLSVQTKKARLARAELGSLKASASWKMTRPLRGVGRVLASKRSTKNSPAAASRD